MRSGSLSSQIGPRCGIQGRMQHDPAVPLLSVQFAVDEAIARRTATRAAILPAGALLGWRPLQAAQPSEGGSGL